MAFTTDENILKGALGQKADGKNDTKVLKVGQQMGSCASYGRNMDQKHAKSTAMENKPKHIENRAEQKSAFIQL